MFTIKQTPEFEQWIGGLKDGMTRIRLGKRLDKAQRGNLGDVEPVGEGVSKMREHFGPGWRMSRATRRCADCHAGGGDKSTQKADSKHAIALAKTLQEFCPPGCGQAAEPGNRIHAARPLPCAGG